MGHEAAFEKLSRTLRHALESPTIQQCNALVFDALQQTERLAKVVATAAVKRGRKGGSKTAERGSDYFRKIAAMRKTRSGGRPKKQPKA
jgi:hypothetical protein